MTTFPSRVSRLPIIPVDRDDLLNAVITFAKTVQDPLPLKDICTRRLLLLLGDDQQIYQMFLSPSLVQYITYDYFVRTTPKLLRHDQFLSNRKLLFCRDCSVNDLSKSKCRRRKCLANRLRELLEQLSCQIIPWEKGQRFDLLENEDDDNSIVFIHLKRRNSLGKLSKQQSSKQNAFHWIEEQFYLLDLLRLLQINITYE